MTGRLWFTICAIVPETMDARGCSFDNSERILNDNRGNTEGTGLILYVRGWKTSSPQPAENRESTSVGGAFSVSAQPPWALTHTDTVR